MSIQLAEAISVTEQHLDPRDVAAYVDRAAAPGDRARIESHLATCAECRAEVSDAARIIATLPRSRRARRSVIVSAAGIAAMLLVFLFPRADRDKARTQHRESAVTATIPPVVLAPVGAVQSAAWFTWSSVPHASRYDVRVFDTEGSVVWHGETPDTVLALPPTIGLSPGHSYYWKVEAQTGFERSVSTELVEFSIRGPRE
jgi:hypothetical protein